MCSWPLRCNAHLVDHCGNWWITCKREATWILAPHKCHWVTQLCNSGYDTSNDAVELRRRAHSHLSEWELPWAWELIGLRRGLRRKKEAWEPNFQQAGVRLHQKPSKVTRGYRGSELGTRKAVVAKREHLPPLRLTFVSALQYHQAPRRPPLRSHCPRWVDRIPQACWSFLGTKDAARAKSNWIPSTRVGEAG